MESLENAVASSCNDLHLYFHLDSTGLARPVILTLTIFNLDFEEKYKLSVIGHELWHFTGASSTIAKRSLLLNALRDELEGGVDVEFTEKYNEKLVKVWEAIAYMSQLRLPATPPLT